MTIVVTATIRPKPGLAEQVAAIYAEAAVDVHKEEGCELYAVHTNRDGVYLVEKWTNGAALRTHAEGEGVRVIRARTADLVEGPTQAVIMKPYPESADGKGAV
ncbi:putative quinol monooxygenase [Parafrankia elaeagni]|uniref:putative quinol monooxygenase n=1 Tax=Parafrankia elaeagni TaxID=222534 RepID=UPI00037495A8|nr:putative quinol monooxygenase [Parafrankia elaeagni]